jgi:serine/threonine protein kinase
MSFADKYDAMGKIGEGGQANVFTCKRKADGEIYVLKDIDLRSIRLGKDGEKKLNQLRRELDIHTSMDHINVVKCFECFEETNRMYLILEYCPEGDVMDLIDRTPEKRLAENNTKRIVQQVARALQYLHGRKLVHRDIKPENILLSGEFDESGFPICKLSDFGVSKQIRDATYAHTYVGN